MSEQPTGRSIRIRGGRTNNLQCLDIDIPRNRLVVFVGVSGSGKSSLVFDTIAAEAGHLLNETYPPFVRNRLPVWHRPHADQITGLSPVITIDQRRIGGNARSTVGTFTDAYTYLRLVYSRAAQPHVGESYRFSFNDPEGMCPTCSGLGQTLVSAVDRFLDLDRSLSEGAILLPGFGNGGYWYSQYADIGSFDADTPLRDWTPDQREALLYGGGAAARLGTRPPSAYEGVVDRFERIHLRTTDNISARKQAAIDRFTRSQTCPDCEGERLHEAARTARLLGHTIGDLGRMEVGELVGVVDKITEPNVRPAVAAMREILKAMVHIGLGYLSLMRATTSLSGGESQRIKTIRHLGSGLTEMLYIFDEPTIGLHPHDVAAMTDLLVRLRDNGNSVLVVEHDTDVMRAADQVVEIGPAAGADGGHLVYSGPWSRLCRADTPTGAALRQQRGSPRSPRPATGTARVVSASLNNLRDVTVDIPLGVLTVLTGVAGSGKSSLAAELVAQHEARIIDQRPVGVNRRSTPMTFTGIAPVIRKLFARANNVSEKLFSANSEGACGDCDGSGVIYTDLAFMDGHETSCHGCGGRRFRTEVLDHTLAGFSIADIEDLTVDETRRSLDHPVIAAALDQVTAVGLGYLRLGQPLSTLSGGECQRLKIAKELTGAASTALYILDEPTTGLHLSDIDTLLDVVDSLVETCAGVVVIEHHLDVVAHADWVIDLGPGPGKHGGLVVFEGTPANLCRHQRSITGRHLHRHLDQSAAPA